MSQSGRLIPRRHVLRLGGFVITVPLALKRPHVLGAYLAWSLICAEVLSAAGRTKDMPALFGTENANKVPAAALWLTNAIVQLFVISTYWSRDAFALMLNLTSVMALIPFLLVAAYGLLIVRRGETYERDPGKRKRDLIFAGIAVIYTLFLIFAAGTKFLLLSLILYVPGTALYFWARIEQKAKIFTPIEWVIFIAAAIGAVVGVHGLVTGYITI